MKKLNLIICLFISCSYLSVAQTTYSISSIKFILPQEAVKINTSNLDLNKRKDKIVNDHENIYNISNIFLGISATEKGNMSNTHLEDFKKGQDFLMKRLELLNSLNYQSEIKTINNNKILILYSFYNNIGDYFFMVLKNDNSEIFSGRIAFENQSNYTEATGILDDFLISVQFE